MKEHFDLVLEFLVNMRKYLFAEIGAFSGSKFHIETSNLEFTQELMNDTFLLFSNWEFTNRKFFFENGENDPFIETLIWHSEPLIKAMERIKLPPTNAPTQLVEGKQEYKLIAYAFLTNPPTYKQYAELHGLNAGSVKTYNSRYAKKGLNAQIIKYQKEIRAFLTENQYFEGLEIFNKHPCLTSLIRN